MQQYTGNPPPTPPGIKRTRLLVRARTRLPKAFLWEIIESDGKGNGAVVVRSSLPETFPNMEAAYEAGKRILADTPNTIS